MIFETTCNNFLLLKCETVHRGLEIMNQYRPKRMPLFKQKGLLNFDLPMLFLMFLLLAYSAIRSDLLSFIHDESFSYLRYHRDGLLFGSPNNHILNTILMKLFGTFLGESEIILRLPNVFAHALFLWMGWKVLKKLHFRSVIFFGFLLLNANPLMLDYFSLARGYGLSLGFFMASIYFLLDFYERPYNINLFFAFMFSALAVLSNLSLFNYHLALSITLLVVAFSKYEDGSYVYKLKSIFEKHRMLLIMNFFFVVFISCVLMYAQKLGLLYIGGKVGFLEDTINSLFQASLYFSNYNPAFVKLIRYILFSIFLGTSCLVLYVTTITRELTKASCMLLITGLCILISVAEHHILGVNYPTDRSALFFLPLFSLCVIFATEYLMLMFQRHKALFAIPLLVVPAVVCSMNFFNSINFSKTYLWGYDANTKMMIEDLQKEYVNMNNRPASISLGINWLFEPTINYYRLSRRFEWLQPVTREGYLSRDYAFYYVLREDINELQNKQDFTVIKQYPGSDTILAMSKTKDNSK